MYSNKVNHMIKQPGLRATSVKPELSVRDRKLAHNLSYEGAPTSATTILGTIIPGNKSPERQWTGMEGHTDASETEHQNEKESDAGKSNTTSAKIKPLTQI